MPEPDLFAVLDRALARQGSSLRELSRKARAVALFGSRAAGCGTATSDWDLLCIGVGSSRKLRDIDLVWIEPRAVESAAWLGGDLAGHIAAHGLWIEGKPGWDLGAVSFPAAARVKESRVARSVVALARAWDLLGPEYRVKHVTLLRRDVQRWRLLQRGFPIPPSAVLDAAWDAEPRGRWLADTLLGMNAPPELARSIAVTAEAPASGWRGKRQD